MKHETHEPRLAESVENGRTHATYIRTWYHDSRTTSTTNSRTSCTSWFKHKPPKFRQPRMPHALATRMSDIWYHADRHE